MAAGERETERPEAGKGMWKAAFFAGTSNQISLMKWAKTIQPTGPEMKGIHALLPLGLCTFHK